MRSTISQEKLNGLAILSIESELLEHLKYNNIINDFIIKKKKNEINFLNIIYNFFK